MNEVRVLHIAETIKGGVATVLNSLFGSKYNNATLIPFEQAEALSKSFSEVFYFKGSRRNFRSLMSLFFSAFITVKRGRFDLVHLHSSFALICAPMLYFIFPKTTVVYHPHGVYYDPDVPRNKVISTTFRFVEYILVKCVDCVLAISEYEYRLLCDLHGERKVSLLRNSVAPSHIPYPSGLKREGYLFVGRLDEQKGVDLLTAFWCSAQNLGKLEVIGDSIRSDFSKMQNNNIFYHGWVDPSELDAWYAGAEAIIVPSRWEGFGLVVIEAYRNGTPVIVSNNGGLPELVDDGVTGYVFDFNDFEQSLQNCLNRFSSVEDHGNMNDRCYQKYNDNFKESEYVKQYERIIDELLPL